MLVLLSFLLQVSAPGPAASPTPAPAPALRPLGVDDLFALREVADPRVSPDGRAVAFTVSRMDIEKDRWDSDVLLAPFGGGEAIRLTATDEPEHAPRFSPDGRWIAFLSGRDGGETQVWLIRRDGGEGVKLTAYQSSVSDLAWAPDSRRLALVVSDVDEAAAAAKARKDGEEKAPRPIVLRRLQFKRDGEGYLTDLRTHIHVFDVEARAGAQVTWGPYDDSQPAWSPDGTRIAFTSNRTADPDRNQDTGIHVVEARPGAEPVALPTGPGRDQSPAWSPDGRSIVYVAGGDPADMWYAPTTVATVPADGHGTPTILTAALDRWASSPRFSADGRHVYFLLEDAGNQHLARVPAAGGALERVVDGEREVAAFDVGRSGAIAVLASEPLVPEEVYAIGPRGALSRVSRVNDSFLDGIRLSPVERHRAKGADGTPVDYFLTRPADVAPGNRLPTVLRIHGGPVAQYSTGFNLEWQMLAAHGYAVVGANPRGSSGYGRAFSHALWANWGGPDYDDVMAAVDDAVAQGVADPERLGVGGWSYGGILTNYVITKTARFKAAISGSSEVNYTANYGHDHYQYEWEAELGLPWENVDRWVKLSPFFQLPRVRTPTLVLCGSDDWNVPLLNSEQLYQALRRLGVPTELVVYPGEAHGIRRPSFVKDRLQRYLVWYDRWLRPESAAARVWDVPAQGLSLLGRPLRPAEPEAFRRRTLEENLARAQADQEQDPASADTAIWLGRRTAYLGRFREAIDVYTRALAAHPEDARLLRHRGHRYISVRRLDDAVADLTRAAGLVRGQPDEVEPDGEPNALDVPTSTLQFNVFYHLGLAHYLKGDFGKAADAWRECLQTARTSDDRRVAASDWLYLALRRSGREAEAREVLEGIRPDLHVIENKVYHRRLLLYKGELTPQDLMAGLGDGSVDAATVAYGVGAWHLVNGRAEEARRLFAHVVQGPQWPAFGFIAAEAELARLQGITR